MNWLSELLFGRKVEDREYAARLRRAVTELMRFSRVLQEEEFPLSRSPERMTRLAHELDAKVRDDLERLRPANKKYERFHTALRRLVRIRSTQAHDTAKFVANPIRHSGVPERTLRLAALAAAQVEIICDELRNLGPEEMQDLLGEEFVGELSATRGL
jgi:hypothetical protein